MKKITFYAIILLVCTILTVKNSVAQVGSTCTDPHIITALPFSETGLSTSGSGNNYSSLPCSGTFPNYLSGNDYVFEFTPSTNMTARIRLTNTSTAVAVFVTDACPDVATACIANNNAALGNPVINSVALTGGTTYYFTVSRSATAGSSTNFNIEVVRIFDYDATVIAVTSPISDCFLSNSEQVTIKVRNVGIERYYDFELGYAINGVPITPVSILDTIEVGDTLTYTFTQNADLSQAGTYEVKAFVSSLLDINSINDTMTYIVNHYPTISTLPYTEDFEQGEGGWSVGGNSPSWALGTPNATVINTPAVGGTNSWVTNLTGNHNLMENSFVYSPCFDLTNYPNLTAKLDIWYQTTPMTDGARLEASINGGSFWFVIGDNDEPFNWYNGMMMDTIWTGSSYGWVTAQHHLTSVGGQSDVRFRIRYKTGLMSFMTEEGFAFDNIMIYECTDLPTAGFTYLQNGTEVIFTNTSTDATNYVWDFGDMMTMLPDTSTNPTYQYMIDGQYTVTLAAYNECGVSYYSEVVNISLVGVNEKSSSSYTIYPNPASEMIYINIPEFENSLYNIRIVNALGQDVYNAQHTNSNTNINIKNLNSGVYFISIIKNDKQIINKLIIE